MAKTTEELNVKITGDSKRAKTALDKTKKAIGGVGDKAKKQSSLLKNFKQNWIGITAAVAGLVVVSKKLLDAYAKQEAAEHTLAAAMKVSGTFTEAAFQHNLDYASSLQQMTTFGDETILSVQKMLTNFGVEGEMLDKLTEQTLNLAAAKGMDLKAAGDLVAKSVGSTTNALTRYGIQVEGAEGSTERMQMAVENISKLFGGAAQAEAETFTGAVTAMKNAFGDFQEGLGEVIADALLPLIKVLKTVFERMNAMPKSIKLVGVVFAATIAAMIAAMLLFKVTLDAASMGITLAISAAIAGIALMIANWGEVQFAFEVAWAAIKIGLAATAVFLTDVFTTVVNGIIAGINFVVDGINLLPGVHLAALDKIGQDSLAAAKKTLLIEQTNLDNILAAHKATAAKRKKLKEDGTKDTETELKKQLIAMGKNAEKVKTIFNDVQELITKSSGTMIDSLVDGIESWKSTSQDVFESLVKGFTAMIVGELKELAKSLFLKAVAAQAIVFPLPSAKAGQLFGASGAATFAAGVVKALGGSAASAITSAAGGADFVTSGPQMMMVGDNPSGRERVTVTPEEQGGGGLTVIIQSLTVMANNVNEMADSIFAQAELAGARPFKRGGFS